MAHAELDAVQLTAPLQRLHHQGNAATTLAIATARSFPIRALDWLRTLLMRLRSSSGLMYKTIRHYERVLLPFSPQYTMSC